jgi:hypothetical protein
MIAIVADRCSRAHGLATSSSTRRVHQHAAWMPANDLSRPDDHVEEMDPGGTCHRAPCLGSFVPGAGRAADLEQLLAIDAQELHLGDCRSSARRQSVALMHGARSFTRGGAAAACARASRAGPRSHGRRRLSPARTATRWAPRRCLAPRRG